MRSELPVVYGIAPCDTVRKARRWLDEHGVAYRFHDYRKAGVPEALDAWIAELGWQKLLNRAGTTWRRLDPARQAQVVDAASAAALMREQPSVIKRPLLEAGGRRVLGFDEAAWTARVRAP